MILLLLFVAFFLFLVHQCWYRRLGLPNGPFPWPIVGNVLSLAKHERWEDQLLKWKNEYGNIYTYWLGPMSVVSVADFNTAIKMFVHDGSSYEERAPFKKFNQMTRGGLYGIIDSSGSLWREQRRFSLRVFRDFGLGKNKMQERILEEMQTICQNVNKEIDAGIDEHDFHKHTDIATGSVINAIICGYRFSSGGKEKEFYKLKDVTEKMMENFSDPLLNIAISSDILLTLPIFKPRFDRAVNLFSEIFSFLNGIIDDHQKTNDYSNDIEPQDFIDAYLSEMARSEERGEAHYFSKIQLSNTAFDLWFAGQETTSSSLTWGIGYLIVNYHVQEQLHKELDRVIGSDRMVTVSDKQALPFTNAVIMEVQRMANIVSINLPRKAARDVVVNGVSIKKGTVIVPQISVMMIDPDTFDEAKIFNPSRFIDENGNFKPADEVVPFSMGKRQCLGEGLARMELFLFIANIFNQYRLKAGKEPPTLKKMTSGVSLATAPYKCRVEKRF